MPRPNPNSRTPTQADDIAAGWFIRRDRGFTAAEQAEFEHWLKADPRHQAAMDRAERVWQAVDPVFALARGAPPDRDFLAPPRRRRAWLAVPLLAAAAVAFVLLRSPAPAPSKVSSGRVVVHPAPQRLTLDDGTLVDLNTGAKVNVEFTPSERRVRLVQGEAYFAVARNPARPFLVSVGRVSVRDVGTAFSVELGRENIAVLVTEGRVGVNEVAGGPNPRATDAHELAVLTAGERGIVRHAVAAEDRARPEVTVTKLTPAQIERALSWQGLRLEFFDRPLGDLVADFNRYNRRQLVVQDAATAGIRVGGNFRADNLDDFVRLLGVGFGVSAYSHGEEILLQKASKP